LLLQRYATYAHEVDGVKATHHEHAESLILFALDEHEGFQAWLSDVQARLRKHDAYFR
jgi:hypothetical protein